MKSARPAAALSAGDEAAFDTGEIGYNRVHAKPVLPQDFSDGLCLSNADFGSEEAT